MPSINIVLSKSVITLKQTISRQGQEQQMFLYRVFIPSECRFSLHMPEAAFFFEHKKIRVAIQVEQVSSAKLTSYSGENLDWLKSGAYLIKAIGEERKEPILAIHCPNLELGLVNGGYVQPTLLSFFTIFFEAETPGIIEDEDNFKDFLDSCLDRFFTQYLMISPEPDIAPLSSSSGPLITVQVSEDYLFDGENIAGNFRFLKNKLFWKDSQRTGHLKNKLSPQVVNQLRAALIEDKPVLAHMRLLLQARRQAIRDHYFDLSIISSQTAFELFCGIHLKNLCDTRKIHDLTKKRGSNEIKIPLDRFIERENIGEVLSKIVEISGLDIKKTPEHILWKEHAYEKRNLIVHRGWSNATIEDAKSAFEAVNEYISLISKTGGIGFY